MNMEINNIGVLIRRERTRCRMTQEKLGERVVVSTLSVLYTGESDDSQVLTERLKQDKNAEGELVFTPLVALSFMLFVLIYFPCIATISAIVHESGSWKWGIFVIVYTCVLAWFVSCVVYQTGHFFMNLFN